MESLRQELEKERGRCNELEQKMDLLRSRCGTDGWSALSLAFFGGVFTDLMEVCLCLSHHSNEDSPSLRPKAPPSLVAAGSVKGELTSHLKETFCPFIKKKRLFYYS